MELPDLFHLYYVAHRWLPCVLLPLLVSGEIDLIIGRLYAPAVPDQFSREPLWTELEKLNVPVGFHPTGNSSLKDDAGARYVGHANFHPIAHAIRNPVELMGAIASMTTGGILERHPKLRCARAAVTT
jgi:hypothetical protein